MPATETAPVSSRTSIDVLPTLRHLRRGSPVGVEFYQSYAYRAKFFDNLFEADWSARAAALYGADAERRDLHGAPRSRRVPARRADADQRSRGRTRRHLSDDRGRPGSRAASIKSPGPAQSPCGPDMTGILAVVRQPQPLSTWGWDAIEKRKAVMGASFQSELEKLARSSAAAAPDRVRAVLGCGATACRRARTCSRRARQGSHCRRPRRRRLRRRRQGRPASAVAAALKDSHPLSSGAPQRRSCARGSPSQPALAPVADIYALLRSGDRHVRYAGRLALEHTPRSEWTTMVMAETNVTALTKGCSRWRTPRRTRRRRRGSQAGVREARQR